VHEEDKEWCLPASVLGVSAAWDLAFGEFHAELFYVLKLVVKYIVDFAFDFVDVVVAFQDDLCGCDCRMINRAAYSAEEPDVDIVEF
jgi:hypothetical protein